MLTILLPCFNESECLPELEEGLFPALGALGEHEVLAVDDGSTDGTGKLLQEMTSRRPSLRVLSHPENRGIGASIKTGLAEARGEWIIPLDADLTFHPRHIPSLLAAQTKSGADCVCGSPFLGGMDEVPWPRRLPSLAMNALYRALFDAGLTSYTPMFRLYRVSALKSIPIRSDGFEVSAEILVRLLQQDFRVAEIPVPPWLVVRTRSDTVPPGLTTAGETSTSDRIASESIVGK
ncbi:MAG: glycosyltransferase family 2 protein, partial [Elusimicrobiota bacterium]